MLQQTLNHSETRPDRAAVVPEFHAEAMSPFSRPPTSRPPSALTIVAHDLRGPLASLRLLLELIGTHGASQSIDKVSSCAKRAGNIIDGLEDLLNSVLERTRRTGDPLDFEPRTVRIDEVIRAGVETSRPAASDKSVDVVFDRTEPLKVTGDSRLLLQVIENSGW